MRWFVGLILQAQVFVRHGARTGIPDFCWDGDTAQFDCRDLEEILVASQSDSDFQVR